MRAERVVEIVFGQESQGSGYLITPRHVITARHVVPKPARRGLACSVWPLADLATAALPVAEQKRPDSVEASVGWIDPDDGRLDIAIIELRDPAALGPESLRLGHLPTGELYPRPFGCTGFPTAAGTASRTVFGSASFDPREYKIDLDVGSANATDWRDWAGLSGALVFHGKAAVGVVRTVDSRWQGKLTATPLRLLLEHPDFERYWREARQAALTAHELGEASDSPLALVHSQLYQLDRADPVGAFESLVSGMRGREPSRVAVVSGCLNDLHDCFIRRLAESPCVQRFLEREAAPDQVIAPLQWPARRQLDDPARALSELVDQVFQCVGLPAPAGGAAPDPGALRRRLDEGATVRAFWILVQRQQAWGGHCELLRRFLDFWSALGSGRPAILLVCLAIDEPVAAPAKKSFNPFAPKPPQFEAGFMDEVRGLLDGLGERNTLLPPLEKIEHLDIQPWINRLKRELAGTETAWRFDLLGRSLQARLSDLQARVGEGEHLAQIADDLRQLLPQIVQSERL